MARTKSILWASIVAWSFSGLIHTTDSDINGVRGLFAPSVFLSVAMVGLVILIPILVCQIAYKHRRKVGLMGAVLFWSLGLGLLLFMMGTTAETTGARLWSLVGSSAVIALVLMLGTIPMFWFPKKNGLTGAAILVVLSSQGCNATPVYSPANGDIIFQTSKSAQSAAVQSATNSQYSHLGIVYLQNGNPVVFEAVEPVKATPLEKWVARGENGHFVVKRLRNASAILTPEALKAMKAVGEEFAGKHYDLTFEWSNERIYCSELVWKIYKEALNLEIGSLQTLNEFDLSSPVVRQKIKERWPDGPPRDEIVISPAAMFNSELLIEIHRQ